MARIGGELEQLVTLRGVFDPPKGGSLEGLIEAVSEYLGRAPA